MKEKARREFDAWAHSYDNSILQRLLFEPSYSAFLQWIHAWYSGDAKRRRLLDIGCGTGTLAARVVGADLPFDVVGLDYSFPMCDKGEGKAVEAGVADRVCFVNADSEHLPFPDASFDVVTCSNSFHHYPHQQETVHQMRRVLMPGGRLMLIDGFRDNMIGWFVFDVCVGSAEKPVFHSPWSTMRRYFERAGFARIMQHKIGILAPILLTIGEVEP
ncbi:MAG: methyltransferase domain-containing protein [Phycisphaerales bacterium]|nr:MAG: methyltransferase domain-containing protein [Phycisphaerales bacterium]